MRYRSIALSLILLASAIPPAQARQSGPPTAQETGFNDNKFSVPVAVFSNLIQTSIGPNFGASANAMAVDSKEVVHSVAIVGQWAPDGTHTMVSLVYQNNISETRRANGFSDPYVLRQSILRNNGEQSQAGDSGGVGYMDLAVDKDDTVHVVWSESIYTLPQSDPRDFGNGAPPNQQGRYLLRLFHASRVSGVWQPAVLLTPEVPPGYAPPSIFPSSLVWTLYGNDPWARVGDRVPFALKLGSDGRPYLLTSAEVQYNYQVPTTPHFAGGIFGMTLSSWLFRPLDGEWAPISEMTARIEILYNEFGEPYLERRLRESFLIDYAVGPGGPLCLWIQVDEPNGGPQTASTKAGGTSGAVSYDEPMWANDIPVFSGGATSISMVFDSQGVLHLMWVWRDPNTPVWQTRYRDGLDGPVQIESNIPVFSELFVDDQDQVHFFRANFEEVLNPSVTPRTLSVTAYTRTRASKSGPLSPTFAPSGTVAFETPILGASVHSGRGHEMLLSKRGRIHLRQAGSGYVCSGASVLGVRDSGAMVGVLPHGQANVTSGNLYSRIPLFSTAGVGPTQAVDLAYNSLDGGESLVGNSWRLSAETCIIDCAGALSLPGERVTLVQPDGRRVSFTHNAQYGAMIADFEQGIFARVERQVATKEYKLVTKTGDVFWFNSNGRLRRVEDPVGNYMDLLYQDIILFTGPNPVHAFRLSEIRDMNGARSTSFMYEATNLQYGTRINQITDPAGGDYRLTYVDRAMSTVQFSSGPGTPTFECAYYPLDDDVLGRRGLLSTFKTPRARAGGYQWSCFYHQNGRLAEVDDPSEKYLREGAPDTEEAAARVAVQTLRYTDASTTWLTDRRGFRTKFVGDGYRSLVSEIHDEAVLAQAPGITPVIRSFTPVYGVLVDVQDRWGFHTSFWYDTLHATPGYVKDNVVAVFKPNGQGSGQDLVATYTYTADGLNRLASTTTYATPPEGTAPVPRTTTYDYNTAGQLVTVHYPDVTYPDGSRQIGVVSRNEYSGLRGQLTRSINENNHGVTYSNFDGLTGLPQNVLAEGGIEPQMFTYDAMGNLLQSKEPRGDSANELPGWTVLNRDGLYRVYNQIDPKGKMTQFTYDVDSNLLQVTPPVGSPTVTIYDRRGLLSGGVTPDGGWNQWVDAAGNVRRTQDVRGFFTNRDLDFMGRVVEMRSPGASTVTDGTGGGGQDTEKTQYQHDGFEATVHFSKATQKAGTGDRVTRMFFDSRGRTSTVLAPDGSTSSQTFYDELDQVVATQSTFGNEVQQCVVTFRDPRDRAFKVRRQNGPFGKASTKSSATYTLFDPAGNVSKTVDELGDVTKPDPAHKRTYLYDARERLQYEIDGKGVIVREHAYGEDNLLREVRVPDPQAKSTQLVPQASFAYTSRKEMRTSFDRNGKGVTHSYGDLPGQTLTTTDALGQVTQAQYDPNTVRVNQVTEALGTAAESRTLYGYTNGLLTQTQVWNPQTQAYNATHTRTYDQAGRLEKVEGPGVAPEQYFYNAFSEVSKTVAGARTLNVTYNTLGQTVQKAWSGSHSAQQTLSYDGAGFVKSISDGNLTRAMSYETWKGAPLDEVFSVGGSIWKLQTHKVDDAGNHVGFTDPEAKDHEWPVDENNRPTQKRYGNQTVSTLSYTPGGLIDREVIHNASGAPIATTVHSYDGLGRRVSSRSVDNQGQVLSEYGWDHNDRHDVVAIRLHHLNAHFTISVDERGRVAGVSTPGNQNGLADPPAYDNEIGGTATGVESAPTSEIAVTPKAVLPVPARTASYTYAPGGNRMSQTVDGVTTTYTYNAANQLIAESAPNRSVNHTYDEWGNETIRATTAITQTPSGPVSEVTNETYGYNHLNLLSTYTNSRTGALWQYDYYPTGERYGKTDLNAQHGEVYVPRFGDVVTEYDRIASTSNVQIAAKNTYVQGIGIDSKSTRISTQQSRRHFLTDQAGTVGITLDDGGTVVDSSVKDPWGAQIAGGTSERYGGVAQRELDTESGLTYMRHRMYDPATGRFTQTDPLLGNRPFAQYKYCANDPINNIDPLGLDEFPIRTDEKSGLEVVQYWNTGGVLPNDEPFDIGLYDRTSESITLFNSGSKPVSVPYEVLQRGLSGLVWKTGPSTAEGWYAWAKSWRESQSENPYNRKSSLGALHQQWVRPPNWENTYQGWVNAVNDATFDIALSVVPEGKLVQAGLSLKAMLAMGAAAKAAEILKKSKVASTIIRTTERIAARGGHHVFPRYLGGAHLQTLAKIPKKNHDALHAALDAFDGGIFRRFKGGEVIRNDYTFEQIVTKLRRFYKSYEDGKYVKLFEQALEETIKQQK